MKYERDLQAKLDRRYQRMLGTSGFKYAQEAEYLRAFVAGTSALRAMVDVLGASEPGIDADQWLEKGEEGKDFPWPPTERGRAKVAWRLVEHLASGKLNAINVGFWFEADGDINTTAHAMTEQAVGPFIEYLQEHLGTESEVLYLLERLKRRIEWFDKDELAEKCTKRKGQHEKVYDDYIRKFLFDQGIDNPFSQPRSASGDADIVSGLDGDDPLVAEIKLYDGEQYRVPYLATGFNQARQYAQDYGKPVGHLIVINLSDHNLHLPSDEAESLLPPRLHDSGVTVYMVVVRAKRLVSVSKRGKQETRIVKRGELILGQK